MVSDIQKRLWYHRSLCGHCTMCFHNGSLMYQIEYLVALFSTPSLAIVRTATSLLVVGLEYVGVLIVFEIQVRLRLSCALLYCRMLQ